MSPRDILGHYTPRSHTQHLARQHQKWNHLEDGHAGDCWRTVIACLLEIPRDHVPHFAELYPDESSLDWWYKAVEFVEKQIPGWTLKCLSEFEFPIYKFPEDAPKKVILSGRSPRGDWHHVILVDAVTGEKVWDPAKTKGNLLSRDEVYALTEIEKETIDDNDV